MEDDDENGRRFSLIRAPFPSLPDLSEYDQVAPFTKNDAGSLDAVCEAIYENLPIQHNPEAFSAETVHTPPGRLEPDNSQTDSDALDFDNLSPDGTYCTIPGRAIKKYGSLGRRDSVDTVASSDNEAKREQKAAYRQELRNRPLYMCQILTRYQFLRVCASGPLTDEYPKKKQKKILRAHMKKYMTHLITT